MVFNSIESLEKHLLDKIESALYVTGELVYDKADEKLAEFYAEYDPDYYKRTNQLRDNTLSFRPVKRTYNGAEVEVGYTDTEVNYKHGNTTLTISNSMMGAYPHGGYEFAGGEPIFVKLLDDLFKYGYADYAIERGLKSVGIHARKV